MYCFYIYANNITNVCVCVCVCVNRMLRARREVCMECSILTATHGKHIYVFQDIQSKRNAKLQ